MNRSMDSVRTMMQYGLDNGKTSMIVYLEELQQLFDLVDELKDVTAWCHAYWVACAEAWHANEGRVTKTDKGAVVMANDDIERLCEIASQKVMAMVAKLGIDPKPDVPA